MNLKTYFRGLGLGIFVTALILSMASGNEREEMSDDEIRARAAELGMVSENAMLLSQAQALADSAREKAEARTADKAASSNTAVSTDAAKPDIISGNVVSRNTVSGGSNKKGADADTEEKADRTDAADKMISEDKAAASDSAASDSEASHTAAEEKEDIAVGGQTDGYVTITVSSGESSVSVANKLLKAGLITDAKQFDSYLVLSGYDRRLVVGSHVIPVGSTPAEMGQILTTKQ